ncbi:M24 family metallopeptidase [bacterium]|nr:M24 family metallopeptidase [bacterium]
MPLSGHPPILPVRKRAEIVNSILKERLDTLLPAIMREHGLDMWLMVCQEDNYDPVMESMIPYECWFKILNFLIFFDRGGDAGVERIDLGFSRTGGLYEKPWRGMRHAEQWELLPRLVEERDPKRIGINVSSVNWASDGLSHGLYLQLCRHLPEKYVNRLVSAEAAAVQWLMTHVDRQLQLYRDTLGPLAHWIIKTLASRRYVTPGRTTTEDMNWAYWQMCTDLGIEPAFKPNYYIRRRGVNGNPEDNTVQEGDMLLCDVGIQYLDLHTDMTEWSYVLSPGETDVPDGFHELMRQAHRLQDIYMAEFREGLSGNQLLRNILARAHRENVPNPKVYSHSCGLFVHEPGPLIGLPWEQQDTGGRGEVPCAQFHVHHGASVEMPVAGWGGQSVRLALEQDVIFTRAGVEVIDGRQTQYHLI